MTTPLTDDEPAAPDSNQRGIYSKFKSEMVAGGAVETTPGADRDVAIIGGVIVLALFTWLGVTDLWMLLFVVGILVSIFLHEVGHYATAKWAGMKVTQFYMGFGPKIWSRTSGEVEYGVRAIPAGAFVRIVGMSSVDEVEPADEDRTYRQKPYRWRLLVITAGSLMHMIIAFFLLFGLFAFAGHNEEIGTVTVIEAPDAGTPAAEVGIRAGDVILAVGDVAVSSRDELTAAITAKAPGDETTVTVRRDGSDLTVPVVLAQYPKPTDKPNAYLGVSTESTAWVDKSVPEAAGLAVSEMGRGVGESVKGVVTVLNPVNIWGHLTGTNNDVTTRPTTLVGATQVSGWLGQREGFKGVVVLWAGVNLFVGIFNLLPLLPFDGGHAAIATYEKVREMRSRTGRRYFADVEKMMPLVIVVLALVGFLFLTGLYLDIAKPL